MNESFYAMPMVEENSSNVDDFAFYKKLIAAQSVANPS
jgi:hypothetical protein